jgi:anaerobic selenocysteine-containing dehydrogenase
VLEELGLDPLPGYVPPERDGKTADVRTRYPLVVVTGDREKSYHHSRFRDQPWALKVSPDPHLFMHPDTARAQGLDDGDWVRLEVAEVAGHCRLKLKLSDAQQANVVSTGMGWWRPMEPAPEHGVFDVNINAALSYSGPYDPMSGSSDIRGQLCRVERIGAD